MGQKINDKLGMRGKLQLGKFFWFSKANDLSSFADDTRLSTKSINPKNSASPTAELVFENVFLPASTHVVGEVNGATLCMMRTLEIERVALAAMAIGIARRSLDEMMAYAVNRPAFGRPDLYGFGQVQKHISESYAEYMAGKCYLYGFANSLDLSTYGNGLDADGVKLYCAQMAKNVADRAIQVLGGYGYVGEYTVERLWRDAKLLEIGGGTNESHHKNISRDLRKMAGNKLE